MNYIKSFVLLLIFTMMLSCGDDVFVNSNEVVASDYSMTIEIEENIIQGQFADIDVNLATQSGPIGGFNFSIAYDFTALSFQGAYETESFIYQDCSWEYFTYRLISDDSRCDGGRCPSGLIKVVGIAETNNGPIHPVSPCNAEGTTLFSLSFMVSMNRNLEGTWTSVRFFWLDCGDNSIADESGRNLFTAASIYEFDPVTSLYNNIGVQFIDSVLPTHIGTTVECDPADGSDIYRQIDFYNGGVSILGPDSIDGRGDLNLDGLGYTIADAVMYSNYFIEDTLALLYIEGPNQYGLIPGYAGSIAASDVNNDGNTLTVADFVYLTRIMIGEALPNQQAADTVLAQLTDSNSGTLSIDQPMGAVLVIFEGEITPVLLAENVEMKFSFDGVNTRVLVYSFDGNSFVGNFLQAENDIVSIELATPEGSPVRITNFIP